ncbi:MAG: hypothetical protein FRX49_00180 [Trebouxia sp. A1-2]|nr:MAG: hypothetical protein FRX49_00180 [Trebouxia sp. A1-2]
MTAVFRASCTLADLQTEGRGQIMRGLNLFLGLWAVACRYTGLRASLEPTPASPYFPLDLTWASMLEWMMLRPQLEMENIEQMHLFAHFKKLCKKPRGLIRFVMASGNMQLLNKILPCSLIEWRRRHTVVLLNKRRV